MPVLKCLHRWSDSILRLKCLVYFTTSYPQPFSIFGNKHDWNCLMQFATANSDQNIATVPILPTLDYWIYYYLWEIRRISQKMFLSASDSSCLHNVCSCSPVVSWGYSCHTTSSQYIQYIQYQNPNLEKRSNMSSQLIDIENNANMMSEKRFE